MDYVLFQNYICACGTFGRVQNKLGTTIWRNYGTGYFFFIHWQVNEVVNLLQWMNDTAGYKIVLNSESEGLAMKEIEFLSLFQHYKNIIPFSSYLSNYYIVWKIWKIYESSNQETKIISNYTTKYSTFNILSLENSPQVWVLFHEFPGTDNLCSTSSCFFFSCEYFQTSSEILFLF